MENKEYISIEDCCTYYSVEASFVRELDEHGLIELTRINQAYSIDHDQLSLLEKYMHMHYDLDINMEGMEVISQLLQRIEGLQAEVRSLRRTV